MLPQLDWAVNHNKYAAIVMNPNQCFKAAEQGLKVSSKGMAEHAEYVWKTFVEKSGFENLLLIAHSAGGGSVSHLMQTVSESLFSKVKQVAFTDSFIISR